MIRTTNGFDHMNESDFIKTLNNISGKMTGNVSFFDLQNAVAAFNLAKAEFLVLSEKADRGSKDDLLARDAKRITIVTQLRNLGNAVTAAANGDVRVLESSGFTISKERQPSSPLEKPQAPKVFAGVNNGELNCSAKKQVGNERVSYMISTEPAVESSWTSFSSSRSKHLFSNLQSGQRYYIKYALCGVRNQEVMSDTVSHISQ